VRSDQVAVGTGVVVGGIGDVVSGTESDEDPVPALTVTVVDSVTDVVVDTDGDTDAVPLVVSDAVKVSVSVGCSVTDAVAEF